MNVDEILAAAVKRGWINEQQALVARAEAEETGDGILDVLIENRFLTKKQAGRLKPPLTPAPQPPVRQGSNPKVRPWIAGVVLIVILVAVAFGIAMVAGPGDSVGSEGRSRIQTILQEERKADRERAILLLDEAIEIDPRCSEAYSRRARRYREAGQPHLALTDADRAVRNRGIAVDFAERGKAQVELNRGAAALKDFEQALKKDPELAKELAPWIERARK